MNTVMNSHSFFDWIPALRSIQKCIQKIIKGTTDADRADIPKEKVLEYVYDTIPGLRGKDIQDPKVWKCPQQDLPTPLYYQGDLVVWNDEYVPPTHGSRTSFRDDGPFEVSIVDDFIIAFTRYENGSVEIAEPRPNRIAVETPGGRVIIAHPGYFKLFKRKQ